MLDYLVIPVPQFPSPPPEVLEFSFQYCSNLPRSLLLLLKCLFQHPNNYLYRIHICLLRLNYREDTKEVLLGVLHLMYFPVQNN